MNRDEVRSAVIEFCNGYATGKYTLASLIGEKKAPSKESIREQFESRLRSEHKQFASCLSSIQQQVKAATANADNEWQKLIGDCSWVPAVMARIESLNAIRLSYGGVSLVPQTIKDFKPLAVKADQRFNLQAHDFKPLVNKSVPTWASSSGTGGSNSCGGGGTGGGGGNGNGGNGNGGKKSKRSPRSVSKRLKLGSYFCVLQRCKIIIMQIALL